MAKSSTRLPQPKDSLQRPKYSTTAPIIDFFTSDLSNEVHANAILSLMEEFSTGLLEGGEGLPMFTKDPLIPELDRRDNCHLLLGMDDDAPVGVTIFFEVFSSFVCKPVLKIHDSRSYPRAPVFVNQRLSKAHLPLSPPGAQEKGYRPDS